MTNTCMWKYYENTFAFQTNDKDIAFKMKRRKGLSLFNYGINCEHWVYHLTLEAGDSEEIAIRILKKLTSNEPIFNSEMEVWES